MAKEALEALRSKEPQTARLSQEELIRTLQRTGGEEERQLDESTAGVSKSAIEEMLREDVRGTRTHVRDATARVSGDILKQLQALSEPEEALEMGTQRVEVDDVLALDLARMEQQMERETWGEPQAIQVERAGAAMATAPLAVSPQEQQVSFPERTIPDDLVLPSPRGHVTMPVDTQSIISSLPAQVQQVDPEIKRQNDFLAKVGMSGAWAKPSLPDVSAAPAQRSPVQASAPEVYAPPTQPPARFETLAPKRPEPAPIHFGAPAQPSSAGVRRHVKLIAGTGIALMVLMMVASMMLRMFVLDS